MERQSKRYRETKRHIQRKEEGGEERWGDQATEKLKDKGERETEIAKRKSWRVRIYGG